MPFEAILGEVDQLNNASTRLDRLAEQHPPMSEDLTTIPGSVAQYCHCIGSVGGGQRPQADLSVVGHVPRTRPLETRNIPTQSMQNVPRGVPFYERN